MLQKKRYRVRKISDSHCNTLPITASSDKHRRKEQHVAIREISELFVLRRGFISQSGPLLTVHQRLASILS